MLLESEVDNLFEQVANNVGYTLSVDLSEQQVNTPDGEVLKFEVDGFKKKCLLGGLDDIDLTLKHSETIKAYESSRKQQKPWLF